MKRTIFSLLIALILLPLLGLAQQGTKERIKIYSKAIEGNLSNDPADRDVTVYLPPSYATDDSKRFPVLYFLHGFTDSDSKWFGWEEHWINLFDVIENSLGEGLSKEMIVVMPNAYNRFKGSMYSNSVTIGDWETFVTKELVAYIDSNYRTLDNVKSRGLAGHSMGGYGTLRLGMKYPEVFSTIYSLSPCCMEGEVTIDETFNRQVESLTTDEQLQSAGFFEIITLAISAAWAPSPANPPLFLDLPFKDGKVRHDIASKIAANQILYTIEQYIPNLEKLDGIAVDAGTNDVVISGSTKKLHDLLDVYKVPHVYESYDGDHLNRIAERIKTKVLPYFSEHLVFE